MINTLYYTFFSFAILITLGFFIRVMKSNIRIYLIRLLSKFLISMNIFKKKIIQNQVFVLIPIPHDAILLSKTSFPLDKEFKLHLKLLKEKNFRNFVIKINYFLRIKLRCFNFFYSIWSNNLKKNMKNNLKNFAFYFYENMLGKNVFYYEFPNVYILK